MKKIGLVFSLVLFFTVSFQVNAQWFWQNPLPFGPFILHDVHIFDQSNFLATTWEGYLLKSTDAGVTWTTIDINNSKRLYAIFFINAQIGWISAGEGAYFKTTDGGNSWNINNTGFNRDFFDICFINENIGFMASNYHTIFKTTNGGISWDTTIADGWDDFLKFCVIDSNTIFVAGEDVYRTTNMGDSWEKINVPETDIYSVFFNDLNNGYVATYRGKVLKTSNGGNSWSTTALGSIFNLYDIKFIDNNNGFVVGYKGIFKTSNGGIGWDTLSITSSLFTSIEFKNNTAVCVGFTSLAVSNDSGNSWELKSKSSINSNLNSVRFLDKDYGWVCGTGDLPSAANSIDGGITWNSNNVPTNHLLDIYFLNKNVGFAVGEASFVGRTTDGGDNWENLNLGSVNRSISFPDSLNGWIVGDRYILNTTDGGFNWSSQEFIQTFNDCFFINDNIGWIIGNNIIKKTTDGGLNWTDKIFPGNYYNIFFTDEMNGWVSGWPGKIFKSNDGGNNWSEQNTGTQVNICAVFGLDAENIWAVGDSGLILKSTNGGNNWINQKIKTNTAFEDIFFIDHNNGWVVGSNGILHTTNGGVTFIEEENSPTQPEQFLLQQNYPNPFNPSTTISWQAPVSGWQTLKVYDILGNEVATLVDEYRNTGSYNAQFTINNVQLSSGVYFYQLRVGDYLETKKMVLLK